MSGTEWFCGVQLGGVKLPAGFPAARNSKSMVHAGTGRWRQKNGRSMLIVGSRPAARINNKPRLSTGSEFCIFNRFPRGHYLVWWVRVRVRVSLGVRVRVRVMVGVRVRVSNLLGSR